jgi:hypothetical protein
MIAARLRQVAGSRTSTNRVGRKQDALSRLVRVYRDRNGIYHNAGTLIAAPIDEEGQNRSSFEHKRAPVGQERSYPIDELREHCVTFGCAIGDANLYTYVVSPAPLNRLSKHKIIFQEADFH